ncbi:hypothetical protein JCM6882_006639 [Rhodosporidiobolus microsporus]
MPLVLPDIKAPPDQIHGYLSFSFLWTVFLPFAPPGLLTHDLNVPPAGPSSLPQWTTQLEVWYQLFHPAVWVVLEEDERVDAAFAEEVDQALSEEEGRGEGPDQELLKELEELFATVQQRRILRFIRLFGAHVARQLHLTRLRSSTDPAATDADLLARAPPGDLSHPPPVPVHSVWPFARSAPSVPFATHMLAAFRLLYSHTWFHQFFLPHYPTPEIGLARGHALAMSGGATVGARVRGKRVEERVDLVLLPSLLNFPALLKLVLPFLPPSLAQPNLAPPAPSEGEGSVPPWSVQAEMWYQNFHPAVWEVLEEDEGKDEAFAEELERRFEAVMEREREAEGVRGKDELERLNKLHSEVNKRRRERWWRLYGAHAVRNMYLQRTRSGSDPGTDTQITTLVEPGEVQVVVAKKHAFWPFVFTAADISAWTAATVLYRLVTDRAFFLSYVLYYPETHKSRHAERVLEQQRAEAAEGGKGGSGEGEEEVERAGGGEGVQGVDRTAPGAGALARRRIWTGDLL